MSIMTGYSFSNDGDAHEVSPSLTRASARATFSTTACLISPLGAEWSVTSTSTSTSTSPSVWKVL